MHGHDDFETDPVAGSAARAEVRTAAARTTVAIAMELVRRSRRMKV